MTDVLTPENSSAVLRGGIVAYLTLDGKGRTMHVHLYVNGSSLMLSDAYPEHGHPFVKPQGFGLHLQMQDETVDAAWARAVTAGCTVTLPLQVMFWGDRYGQLRDPFGVAWSLAATPKAK